MDMHLEQHRDASHRPFRQHRLDKIESVISQAFDNKLDLLEDRIVARLEALLDQGSAIKVK